MQMKRYHLFVGAGEVSKWSATGRQILRTFRWCFVTFPSSPNQLFTDYLLARNSREASEDGEEEMPPEPAPGKVGL